jgi:hypothetical protein
VNSSVFLIVGDNTLADTILHNQVSSKEFNEIFGVVSERLAIKSVKESMASSVSGSTATICLTTLSIFLGLTTKGSLVDFAVLGSGEGAAVVFELNDGLRSFSCHVVNSILVSQPVGSLDRIVHMPPPIVLVHISQCSVDTPLRGHRVRPGRKELGYTGSVEASFSETECGAQASSTGSDDHSIVLVVYHRVLAGNEA